MDFAQLMDREFEALHKANKLPFSQRRETERLRAAYIEVPPQTYCEMKKGRKGCSLAMAQRIAARLRKKKDDIMSFTEELLKVSDETTSRPIGPRQKSLVMTSEEVAIILRTETPHVHSAFLSGLIPGGIKLGSDWRVPRKVFFAWFDTLGERAFDAKHGEKCVKK